MSATVDHIDRAAFQLEQRPTPTPEQWAAWARLVADRAPDLAAMLGVDGIGGAS